MQPVPKTLSLGLFMSDIKCYYMSLYNNAVQYAGSGELLEIQPMFKENLPSASLNPD